MKILFILLAFANYSFAWNYCITKIDMYDIEGVFTKEKLEKKLQSKLNSKSKNQYSVIISTLSSSVEQKGVNFSDKKGIVVHYNHSFEVLVVDQKTGKSVSKTVQFNKKYKLLPMLEKKLLVPVVIVSVIAMFIVVYATMAIAGICCSLATISTASTTFALIGKSAYFGGFVAGAVVGGKIQYTIAAKRYDKTSRIKEKVEYIKKLINFRDKIVQKNYVSTVAKTIDKMVADLQKTA